MLGTGNHSTIHGRDGPFISINIDRNLDNAPTQGLYDTVQFFLVCRFFNSWAWTINNANDRCRPETLNVINREVTGCQFPRSDNDKIFLEFARPRRRSGSRIFKDPSAAAK
jgi:hypothetical protein